MGKEKGDVSGGSGDQIDKVNSVVIIIIIPNRSLNSSVRANLLPSYKCEHQFSEHETENVIF